MKILILLVCVSAAFAQNTIIDVLTQHRYTTLLSLIESAGLTDVLKGEGPFTIFAPSDYAIWRLDPNVTAALYADKEGFLKYHVVGDYLRYYNDLLINERQFTALSNQKLRLNNYFVTDAFTVNGVQVSGIEHLASNGIVHPLNGVLTPLAGTIVDAVKANPQLSTFLDAVTAAGLDGFLADQTPITVFAPTNDAFNKLGAGLVSKILADKDLLKTILTYHVIPGTLYSAGYHSAYLHTFDEADKVRLHKFFVFGYEVDSATVDTTDISASNGVIHTIEDVMVPASVSNQVAAISASLTTTAPTVAATAAQTMAATAAPIAAPTTAPTAAPST